MSQQPTPAPDVYAAHEIARAAGVPAGAVAALIRSGQLPTLDGVFVSQREAVRAVRRLRQGPEPRVVPAAVELFEPARSPRRATGLPLVASSALHAAGFVLILLLSALSASPVVQQTTASLTPVRLVFVALPGPGGGGGGGGLRQIAPPPVAKRKGPSRSSTPVLVRQPPPPAASPQRPIAPLRPLLQHQPLPAIVAPVASIAGDNEDRVGLLEASTNPADSQGSGSGGGVGTGQGTGVGEGAGPGLGPGTGGGMGGGPYRPGSGIDPPRLLREVKPTYTEAARQQNVEGEVVLEVVVRQDGRVSDVRILRPLGSGLDERAVDAVRQWRFEPARRLGTPVDVVVEVSVEFSLR